MAETEPNVFRVEVSQPEEAEVGKVLRARRIGMLKDAAALGTILGGGIALSFGEGNVQLAGGAIFLGTLLWPVVEAGRDAVRSWRGDDLRKK